MHENMPFALSGNCLQQELELRNYDTLVTRNYTNMDIGHTYDMKAQTQWTLDIHMTQKLKDNGHTSQNVCMNYDAQTQTNIDSKRNKLIQEDSNKQKLTIHSSNTNFQSFLNFDKQIQTQTQKKINKLKKTNQLFKQTQTQTQRKTNQLFKQTDSKKNKPTLQINSNINSKIQNKLTKSLNKWTFNGAPL